MNSVTDSLLKPLMRPEQFWLPYHRSRVLIGDSFSQMAWIAQDILKDMKGGPIVQVCGPMTSGGKSYEENIRIFEQAIEYLCYKYLVFNQLPFEEKFQKMLKGRRESGYPHDLLEEFYLPIFQSGKIKILFFLPGWEKSTGASWEHEKGMQFKIPIRYLDANFQEHMAPVL